MVAPRKIETLPYGATIFGEDEASGENVSFMTAVIEPPVRIDHGGELINVTFNQFQGSRVEVSHMVTTISKTLLEIAVWDDSTTQLHDDRFEIAHDGLKEYLIVLNSLENGTFDGHI